MHVELRGITKHFPGVTANSEVDLDVAPGEVHALLGENGAGKSTLMSILSGLYNADEGDIVLDGKVVSFASPREAISAGIGMVHQHFMLIPAFTAAENVMLGVESVRHRVFLDKRKARADLLALAAEHSMQVNPDALVRDLPVGAQQRIEILKALYRKASCLILDEPTAVLTPRETEDLFRVIRELTASGRSVVFISHKLKEVMTIADRITVLRAGRVVGTTVPGETSERELASLMVGRDVRFEVTRSSRQPGRPVLTVAGLRVSDELGNTAVDDLSLEVREGEILAVAGVDGNGQTELVEAITGLRAVDAGTVELAGQNVTAASARQMFRAGVAHIPADRLRDGLVVTFPVRDNLVLNSYHDAPYARRGLTNRIAVAARAETLVREYDVRTTSTLVPAGVLSGGNQQKVIVARELSHEGSNLLIAAQPTRGVDVGSIEYIHSRIVAKRDAGMAVLLVSTELDEILSLADRIAVIYRGRIVGSLARDGATREEIGLLMAGLAQEQTDTVTEATDD
jgi:ABC-type uncharacterized transport system ATPase subunit